MTNAGALSSDFGHSTSNLEETCWGQCSWFNVFCLMTLWRACPQQYQVVSYVAFWNILCVKHRKSLVHLVTSLALWFNQQWPVIIDYEALKVDVNRLNIVEHCERFSNNMWQPVSYVSRHNNVPRFDRVLNSDEKWDFYDTPKCARYWLSPAEPVPHTIPTLQQGKFRSSIWWTSRQVGPVPATIGTGTEGERAIIG